MADCTTAKILVMNGGGNRGYVHPKFLNVLATKMNTTVDELWRKYDVIGGTSAGGIMACALAAGKSYSDMMEFFTKTNKIFTIRTTLEAGQCNTSSSSNKPNFAQKLTMLGINDPFYKSVSTNAIGTPCGTNNYGSSLLYQLIDDYFDEMTLNDLNTRIVVPAIQYDTNNFVMFSNHSMGNMFMPGTYKVADVCKATSAAPMYLPQWVMSDGHHYIDGGLYANNCSQTAIEVAGDLKPYSSRFIITHSTTGISKYTMDGSTSETPGSKDSLISQLLAVPELCMTGSQEMADFNCKLKAMSRNVNRKNIYYSFAPRLPDTFDSELDNSTQAWYDELDELITSKLTVDNALIDNHVSHLML